MKRAQTQHRRTSRRKTQTMKAWIILSLFELLVASIIAGIAAAVLVPLATEMRGFAAVGGEWLLIAAVFCGSYGAAHKVVCNKIYWEKKQ